jgi:hypothetical protein
MGGTGSNTMPLEMGFRLIREGSGKDGAAACDILIT